MQQQQTNWNLCGMELGSTYNINDLSELNTIFDSGGMINNVTI